MAASGGGIEVLESAGISGELPGVVVSRETGVAKLVPGFIKSDRPTSALGA
jgi:hypothetical protein